MAGTVTDIAEAREANEVSKGEPVPEIKKPEEPAKPKVYKVRVGKLMITPVFLLVDEDGDVAEEVTAAAPVMMYPKKFVPFPEFVKQLEAKANSDPSQLAQIMGRPLF